MKIVLTLATLAFSMASFGSTCPDLSGTYQFDGFEKSNCKINKQDSMELSPLPIGTAIAPGRVVVIEQQACDSLKVTYQDSRFSNTQDIDETHEVSLVNAELSESSILVQEVTRGSNCYFGRCLSAKDKMTWELSLLDNGNLNFNFRNHFVGLYNYVLPVAEVVRANCELKRVNN